MSSPILLAIIVYRATEGPGRNSHAADDQNLVHHRSCWPPWSASYRVFFPEQAASSPARGLVLTRSAQPMDRPVGRNEPDGFLEKNIPLAWRNLTENKRRLAASVAGTAFAVTLMFMENGFRHAMLDSMVNVIERLDGQVVIVSKTLYTPGVPLFIPVSPDRSRRGTSPRCRSASPVYVVTRTELLARIPRPARSTGSASSAFRRKAACSISIPCERIAEALRSTRHRAGR